MKFGEILKDAAAEGKEKHVPVIEIDTGKGKEGVSIVRVIVGKEVPHPNTTEHHIVWIDLFGVKESGQVVDLGRGTFGPGYTNPNVRFQVPVEGFTSFCALAYCNIHGLWENCTAVE